MPSFVHRLVVCGWRPRWVCSEDKPSIIVPAFVEPHCNERFSDPHWQLSRVGIGLNKEVCVIFWGKEIKISYNPVVKVDHKVAYTNEKIKEIAKLNELNELFEILLICGWGYKQVKLMGGKEVQMWAKPDPYEDDNTIHSVQDENCIAVSSLAEPVHASELEFPDNDYTV